MIVEVEAMAQGWNPGVVQAGMSGLEFEMSHTSEDLRTALYRSWFADNASLRLDVHVPFVRKVAWIEPGDRASAAGRDPDQAQTIFVQ